MLTKEAYNELAKRAGIEAGRLMQAITAEGEESITFENDGEFIETADVLKIEQRGFEKGKSEGFKAGEEILIKTIRNEEGLEFEGKTKENLVKALKDKILKEAKTEPNERIATLESDNQKLRGLLTDKETEFETEKSKFIEQITSTVVESEIKMHLPDKLENGLTRDDLFTLYKNGRKYQKTENGIELIDAKTGEVIKDRKLNPVPVSEDIKSFIERFGTPKQPGRNAGDSVPQSGESFRTRSEVETYCKEKNIPLSERSAVLAKAMKTEGFDINV